MTQSIDDAIAALVTACQGIFSAPYNGLTVYVCESEPDQYQPPLIVAVAMDVRQIPVQRPTMGTRRSRRVEAEIDVVISAYAAGGSAATARTACNGLTNMLESYFRTSPNETLGGACREAWVSAVAGPVGAKVTHPKSGAVTGRVASSVVTVTASIDY